MGRGPTQYHLSHVHFRKESCPFRRRGEEVAPTLSHLSMQVIQVPTKRIRLHDTPFLPKLSNMVADTRRPPISPSTTLQSLQESK